MDDLIRKLTALNDKRLENSPINSKLEGGQASCRNQ